MKQRFATYVLAICMVLTGCGGGGGGGTSTGTSALPPTISTAPAPTVAASTVNGTAAKGAPLVNATVTVIDANGTTVTGRTDAEGAYSVDVTGLTPPFLVSVSDGQTTLHGIAFGPGICNVTPLSEMTLQLYFQSQGTTLLQAFTDPEGAPLPSEGSVKRIVEAVLAQMQGAFDLHGVDLTNFDPLQSPFDADHTGFDALLDQIVFTGPNAFQFTNGPITITVTVTPMAGGVLRTTVTLHDSTTGAETIQQFDTQVGDAQTFPALDPAVEGVNALLTQIKSTINARGGALAAADILPYLTNDFSHNNETAADFATRYAAELAGVAIDKMEIAYVDFLDPQSGLLHAHYAITRASDPDPSFERMVFQKQADGSWRFHGNHELLAVDSLVRLANARFIDGNADTGFKPTAMLDLRMPPGLLSAVSVSDPTGTFFSPSGTTVPKETQIDLTLPLPLEVYRVEQQANTFPPAGTVFGLELSLLGLSTINEQARLGTTTTDTIGGYSLTVQSQAPTHTVAALAAGPATLSWTPPSTFPFYIQRVVATCRSASYLAEQAVEVPPAQHSVTVPPPPASIPLGAGGPPPESVTEVTYRVEVRGPAGETVLIRDVYAAP